VLRSREVVPDGDAPTVVIFGAASCNALRRAQDHPVRKFEHDALKVGPIGTKDGSLHPRLADGAFAGGQQPTSGNARAQYRAERAVRFCVQLANILHGSHRSGPSSLVWQAKMNWWTIQFRRTRDTQVLGRSSERRGRRFPEQCLVFDREPAELPKAIARGDLSNSRLHRAVIP
jgi:hypothetical protein